VAIVQTVTGPVDSGDLGRVLMHEHVITRSPGLREDYPSTYPRDEALRACVEGLRALKAAGVDTLIDHTTYDLGRDVELLAEASSASKLKIVAATGVWVEPQRFWHLRASTETAELLISDLEDGIAGTGIRAGVIKCAIDREGLARPGVERSLRACAIAHRVTGAHLSTHTVAALRNGLDQQEIFSQEGVDLSRVVIGHCGDTDDLGYLRELLAAGSFLGMDRFGVEDLLSDERRMDVVAALCVEGHAGRLLLSQDASCWSDRAPMAAVRAARPRWHHRHVVEDIVPGLRERGVTERQIETMFMDNPRSVFGRRSPYPGPPSPAASTPGWA
jgi:phosphotriesterase-related protein